MMEMNARTCSSSWKARELLREKGQFWTPDWVAQPMVEYVMADKGGLVFDPAVGAGAFFRAAMAVAREKSLTVRFAGMEIDPAALECARSNGMSSESLASVEIGDFILQPPKSHFRAIVANPPYIRHHRLSPRTKTELKRIATSIIGKPLDGRAGLHVYFLILSLSLLETDGRLAFIVPSDTFEGKFASDLWRWIASHFAIDAVITFSPEATPFPNIDTNPIIVFIRNARPQSQLLWLKCRRAGTDALKRWVRSGLKEVAENDLSLLVRDVEEALAMGLSREPFADCAPHYVLGDFVKVMRGIATGANDFFFMTREKAKALRIPEEHFVRAVGRTRDVCDDEITEETLVRLERHGRPTLLLNLDGNDIESFPVSIKKYLQEGVRLGLPWRPLLVKRVPWYKMERRVPPPFLFAYLGRRNARFIRNSAKVVPLTGFLCVYPKVNDEAYLECIWKVLSHRDTLANMAKIGKTYGGGAIKVEPRSLERLPIPDHVIEQVGHLITMSG